MSSETSEQWRAGVVGDPDGVAVVKIFESVRNVAKTIFSREAPDPWSGFNNDLIVR